MTTTGQPPRPVKHIDGRAPTIALVAALVISAMVVLPSGVADASGERSRFEPVTPCRLVDTRSGAALAPGSDLTVETTGRCGIPAGTAALAVTVTGTSAARDGYLTLWPAGGERPEVSNLNLTRGETRANSAIVRVGRGGAIDVHLDAGGHLLVDVTGVFVPAQEVAAGRFVAIDPQRLVDTRGAGRPAAESTVRVRLPAEVPADATALAINVTTTDSVGAGYFTAFAAGSDVPEASVLNTDGPGQTRAASAIVPVGSSGFEVLTSAGDHLIVDVTGFFTGPSAMPSSSGLFVPHDPVRVLDTRPSATPVAPSGHVLFRGASPYTYAQVAGNVTMIVAPGAGGFATLCSPTPALDCGEAVSNVNADAGAVANAFVGVTVDLMGLGWVRSSAAAHVLIDVTGGFVGQPAPHRLDLVPTIGQGVLDPLPPSPRDPLPAPSDAWARQYARLCLPGTVLARLDQLNTRWLAVPGSGGSAPLVIRGPDRFNVVNLGTANSFEFLCDQTTPHEAMHVLDFRAGGSARFASAHLARFLGPLEWFQHVECLAQAAELLVLGEDRRLSYDNDPVIERCTRAAQTADLAHVLWTRSDGTFFRWSGDDVVPR